MAEAVEIPWREVSVDPNGVNPRATHNQEHIDRLSKSISEKGQLQAGAVRPRDDGKDGYWIVWGEHRWRACKQLDRPFLAEIREVDLAGALELALIENLDREGLTPIEEASGLARLASVRGMSQRQLAELTGRSQGWVANRMRLLDLPDGVQALVSQGELSFSLARDWILPFRALREDLRKPLFRDIENELLGGDYAPDPEAIIDVIRECAVARSRPLRRLAIEGEPAPRFDVRSYHDSCDCGSPAYDYHPAYGTETRCFDIERWEKAQEGASVVPPDPEPDEEVAASDTSDEAEEPATSSTNPRTVLEAPASERKAGVLLVDSSGRFADPFPVVFPEDMPFDDIFVEHVESGALTWWTASSTRRSSIYQETIAGIREEAQDLAERHAHEDLEKIQAGDFRLDVRAVQLGYEIPLQIDLHAPRDPTHRGSGARLLGIFNSLAWALNYESVGAGGDLLGWWRARTARQVKDLTSLLIYRFQRDGVEVLVRDLRESMYQQVREEVKTRLKDHVWERVEGHYT